MDENVIILTQNLLAGEPKQIMSFPLKSCIETFISFLFFCHFGCFSAWYYRRFMHWHLSKGLMTRIFFFHSYSSERRSSCKDIIMMKVIWVFFTNFDILIEAALISCSDGVVVVIMNKYIALIYKT